MDGACLFSTPCKFGFFIWQDTLANNQMSPSCNRGRPDLELLSLCWIWTTEALLMITLAFSVAAVVDGWTTVPVGGTLRLPQPVSRVPQSNMVSSSKLKSKPHFCCFSNRGFLCRSAFQVMSIQKKSSFSLASFLERLPGDFFSHTEVDAGFPLFPAGRMRTWDA